jgi:Flp pilus assembly pilin Flp
LVGSVTDRWRQHQILREKSMFNHALAYVMSVLVADKKDEKGASAVEYALVIGLVAIVIVGSVTALNGKLGTYVDGLKIG